MRKEAGFTLIELIVAVTVLGILLAIGIPSFNGLIRDSQRASAINDLLADMTTARSEAIRRGFTATICASSNGSTCGSRTAWGSGWLVFQDGGPGVPADGSRATTEPIIRSATGRSANLRVSSSTAEFRFGAFGRGVTSGSIYFCDPRDLGKDEPDHSRAIVVVGTGRARVADRSQLTTDAQLTRLRACLSP